MLQCSEPELSTGQSKEHLGYLCPEWSLGMLFIASYLKAQLRFYEHSQYKQIPPWGSYLFHERGPISLAYRIPITSRMQPINSLSRA